MNNISEKDVVGLWLSGRPAHFTDDLGNYIEVVCPGRVSAGQGCDFQDAVIRVNRQKVVGGIEVHVTSDLWIKHGHHKDPSYNGVILHVAMWQKGGLPVRLQDGRVLPTVILGSHIINVHGVALRRRAAAAMRPCAHANGFCKAAGTLLLIEGLRRFEEKAAGFSRQLETAGAGQVLYKGICRALGYARNKSPFEALADRLPLRVLSALAAGSLPGKQALLLGAAGLLPSQRRVVGEQVCDAQMAELESLWKRLCGNIPAGKDPDWNLAFVRPVNHPARRIAALSCLLQRYGQSGLLKGLESLAGSGQAGAAKSLANGLQVNGCYCEDRPQKCHCSTKNVFARSPQSTKQSICCGQIATPSGLAMTMEKGLAMTMEKGLAMTMEKGLAMTMEKGLAMKKGKSPTALLGRGRAGEIAVNVVLPFFTAYARQNKNIGLENRVLDTYLRYPALPANELTRYMSGILWGGGEGKLSACLQQGLIHLYHRYCRVKDCDCCPVFINRRPARA